MNPQSLTVTYPTPTEATLTTKLGEILYQSFPFSHFSFFTFFLNESSIIDFKMVSGFILSLLASNFFICIKLACMGYTVNWYFINFTI